MKEQIEGEPRKCWEMIEQTEGRLGDRLGLVRFFRSTKFAISGHLKISE